MTPRQSGKFFSSLAAGLSIVLLVAFMPAIAGASADAKILTAAPVTPLKTLAAREIRRYVYLRTGTLIPISEADKTAGPGSMTIVVATRTDSILQRLALSSSRRRGLGALAQQQYSILTTRDAGRTTTWIIGGDDQGALYGAYRFAERLGVRFALHGDVIPDQKVEFTLPDADETGTPLFELRGIQPFHDFTEGPDWWELDDYRAICSQLAKLRMNFLGLHCYPEGGVGPEPLVWIGLPEDIGEGGRVRFSYPSRWASTGGGGGAWGYANTKTSDFAAGAGLIFEDDDYGPQVTRGYRPMPTTPAGCNEVFNRAGALLHDACAHARSLGIRVCVGTETPLTIPKAVRQHLRNKGLDPDAPATVRKVYEGMFRRIAMAYPVDYYWLWTPEGWTWSGTKPEQVAATLRDINLADEALAAMGNPFGLATCGWVLGPPGDRALFDKRLPKSVALSCINRQVGFSFVERGFAGIEGRPQWAIPWMEDDPALIIPQLWAGRMRRDAADAHTFGCTGLMGIHWRTKVLAPNMAALAAAAWDQRGWNPDFHRHLAAPKAGVRRDEVSPGGRLACAAHAGRARDLPTDDFYRDWARGWFGPGAADQLARLFVRLDGGPGVYTNKNTRLPRPSDWIGGPGGIAVNNRPWEHEKNRYAFVDEMVALRAKITGAGNLARFDYWLNTFRYLRAVGRLGCTRGALDRLVQQIDQEPTTAKKRQLARAKALPLRLALARQWEHIMNLQLAVVSTPGEMGTIANLEQHVRRGLKSAPFMRLHDQKLSRILGRPLPSEAQPSTQYTGRPRIIVPTKRSQVRARERLSLKVIVLDTRPPKHAAIHWRPMGKGNFREIVLEHVNRGVYAVNLPPARGLAVEYYVQAKTAGDQTLVWPATAPKINQTVVVLPEPKASSASTR